MNLQFTKTRYCELISIDTMSLNRAPVSQLFTHLLLESFNQSQKCFGSNRSESKLSKAVSVIGSELLTAIDTFDAKCFQRLEKTINKRKAEARRSALKNQQKEPKDDQDSSQEEEEEPKPEEQSEEESEVAEDDEEESETEPNSARFSKLTFSDSKFMLRLLSNHESLSEITRTRTVRRRAEKDH